jgi:hypothetical protein
MICKLPIQQVGLVQPWILPISSTKSPVKWTVGKRNNQRNNQCNNQRINPLCLNPPRSLTKLSIRLLNRNVPRKQVRATSGWQ